MSRALSSRSVGHTGKWDSLALGLGPLIQRERGSQGGRGGCLLEGAAGNLPPAAPVLSRGPRTRLENHRHSSETIWLIADEVVGKRRKKKKYPQVFSDLVAIKSHTDDPVMDVPPLQKVLTTQFELVPSE